LDYNIPHNPQYIFDLVRCYLITWIWFPNNTDT
jgi:hypothetical protein